MKEVRYTLTTDGPSDVALIPLLSWILGEQGVAVPITPTWADLRRLPRRPRGLSERIERALDLYPCDLPFVHRDAEGQQPVRRYEEIRDSTRRGTLPPVIGVVPVRMMEAWLLFDENALRRAAGNPNGKMPLSLPRTRDLEKLPDPKATLHQLLRRASGLNGRRLKNFSTEETSRLVSERLDTFAPLRVLSAFKSLEAEVSRGIRENGWDRHTSSL